MEGILQRYGVRYPKANMCNNVIQFHKMFGERIVDLLEKQMTLSPSLHIDETTMQVLREKNRKNTTKSYAWLFWGNGENKVVLMLYRETRKSDFLYDILEDYQGAIITDGYAGYDKVAASLPIEHVGCNAHARRYFVDAHQTGKYQEAETAISYYRQLYAIEATAQNDNLTPEELFSIRQEKSKPIMREFRDWLDKKKSNIPVGKNYFSKAINYTINQWPKLTLYLSDAKLPIDNNAAENCIRPFVIGRNNWKFAGSPRGAEASCMFYSLIETANGHEPYWYLRRLFDLLPKVSNNSEIEKLMPYNMPPVTGPD